MRRSDSGLHCETVPCHGQWPCGLPSEISHTKASHAGCASRGKAMLRVLGMPVTACDGTTRRDLLKVGARALCERPFRTWDGERRAIVRRGAAHCGHSAFPTSCGCLVGPKPTFDWEL